MVANHNKKALCTFQKHLPKLHLTHKSLKLDVANSIFTICRVKQKQKPPDKNKKLAAD
jgi:hypothetical protein